MCGRFTLRTPAETIADLFSGLSVPKLQPSYNIAPTHRVAAVRHSTKYEKNEFVQLHWGLLPSWAKDRKLASRMINARSETVQEKPAFRSAFKKRRCLIVADGFYEWLSTPDGKQPMYITMKSAAPFAFAGLWESNRHVEPEKVETCTVLTTSANPLMAPIHERMPVILRPDIFDVWLDPEFKDHDALQEFLQPYDEDEMQVTAVCRKVNKVSFNDPECIKPAVTQRELF